MSISQLFPEEGPSLSLNFAGSRTLDSRITFTRTSSGTRTNSQGLVEVVPANFPRFDHRYVNGEIESLGLLIEEQRQNLLRRSEEFDDSLWGGPIKNTGTVGVNSITSPDGTLTADKIIPGTNFARHYLQQILGITANITYTVSCFAKAGEYNFASVIFGKGSTPFTRGGSIVNLTTGEITNYAVNSPTNVIRHAPINYGNGWWKISVSVLFDSTSTDGYVEIGCSSLATNYSGNSGDGTSGIYIWGAQLEQGAFSTSYIPTTASTVTRTADNVSMVGENFSSWYNQSEGTVFTAFRCDNWNSSNQFGKVFTINQAIFGVENNGFWIGNDADNSNTVRYRVRSGGVNQFGPANLTRTSTIVKSAIAVKSSDFAITIDGNIPTTSTSGTLPQVMNSLTIGRDIIGVEDKFLNGHISQLTYYPKRLPNAFLQNLTK
jgi:hypothetical protein